MSNKMKKYDEFLNEHQSVTKPIENSSNVQRYDYKNIADVLGYKEHSSKIPNTLAEFEEKIISKLDEKDKPSTDEYYIKMFKEYKRQQFKETPPHSDDMIDNADFGARAYMDDRKMEIENENENKSVDNINEDGVAAAVAGNGSGMGAVITAQPSSTPGQTIGSNTAGDTYGNGGTVGSGDIGAGQIKNRNIIKRPEKSRRKKKAQSAAKAMFKNMKNTFKGTEYKQGGDKNAVLLSFSDFSKK